MSYEGVRYRSLEGRLVVVTGGGSGIGEELVRAFAAQGAAVGFLGIDDAAAEAVAAAAAARWWQADVRDIAALKAVIAEAGPVGVLVNNAGNLGATPTEDARKPFWETGPDAWNQAIGVNLYGVLNCTAAVTPGMIARKAPGRIITIVSDAGRNGEPGLEAYSAAKAGAAGFMRAVARALARFEITANAVSISTVRSAINVAQFQDAALVTRVFEKYIVRRPGTPDDVANMVLFLASNASPWISGQTYAVNGGFTVSL